MTLRPNSTTTQSSNRFYEALFSSKIEIAQKLVKRNNGNSKLSYPSPELPVNPEYCPHCNSKTLHDKEKGEYVCMGSGLVVQEKELVRRKNIEDMTQIEKDEIEKYYQERENNVRGNFEGII